MRICGIDYRGNDLIPIIIQSTDANWSVVDLNTRKITLHDLWDSNDVRLCAKTIKAFLAENQVDRVVIKKRPTSGKFGGGAASFRLGALVQLSTEQPVVFISPQAISSALQDADLEPPDKLFQYQHSAYEVAVAYAERELKG